MFGDHLRSWFTDKVDGFCFDRCNVLPFWFDGCYYKVYELQDQLQLQSLAAFETANFRQRMALSSLHSSDPINNFKNEIDLIG